MEYLQGKNDLQSFIEFATNQCSSNLCEGNRCYLPPLNAELRVISNKNLKKNKKPQIWASLKIGGLFESESDSQENCLGINVELEQISVGMKVLEYTGKYSKFQAEALVDYQKQKFTKEEIDKYSPIYSKYLNAMQNNNEKETEKIRQELVKLEERFTLGAIQKVRAAERLKINLENRQEEAKKETEQKVKDLEQSQSSSFTSIKSFFGSSKARKEQEEQKKKANEYRDILLKEQEAKFAEERLKVDEEIDKLLSDSKPFDDSVIMDMPPTYVQFSYKLEFSKFTLALSQELPGNKSKKLVELSIKGIIVIYLYISRLLPQYPGRFKDLVLSSKALISSITSVRIKHSAIS